jgi:hypothetical protein
MPSTTCEYCGRLVCLSPLCQQAAMLHEQLRNTRTKSKRTELLKRLQIIKEVIRKDAACPGT